MTHSNNRIIKHKAGLLNLAEELGNVSRACKVIGVSSDTFYRYQGGLDALIDKNRRMLNIKIALMKLAAKMKQQIQAIWGRKISFMSGTSRALAVFINKRLSRPTAK